MTQCCWLYTQVVGEGNLLHPCSLHFCCTGSPVTDQLRGHIPKGNTHRLQMEPLRICIQRKKKKTTFPHSSAKSCNTLNQRIKANTDKWQHEWERKHLLWRSGTSAATDCWSVYNIFMLIKAACNDPVVNNHGVCWVSVKWWWSPGKTKLFQPTSELRFNSIKRSDS